MLKARSGVIAGVTAVLLLIAGCGSDDSDDEKSDENASSLPTAFNVSEGIRLPDTFGNELIDRDGENNLSSDDFPLAMHGDLLYATTPATLEVFDMSTGAMVETFSPQRESLRDIADYPVNGDSISPLVAPIITEINGTQAATAFFVTEGDTSDTAVLEVLSVSISNHAVIARTRLPLEELNNVSGSKLRVLNGYIHNNVAYVSLEGAYGFEHFYAVDLGDEKKLWDKESTIVEFLYRDTLFITTAGEGTLTAVQPETGEVQWTNPITQRTHVAVMPLGEDAVAVRTGQNSSEMRALSLSDGSVLHTFSDGDKYSSCAEASKKLSVCHSLTTVIAYTDAEGSEEWRLDSHDSVEIFPYITYIGGNNIYGYTLKTRNTERKPIVFNASDGKIKEENPGVAPVLVGEKFAVAITGAKVLWAFPAK